MVWYLGHCMMVSGIEETGTAVRDKADPHENVKEDSFGSDESGKLRTTLLSGKQKWVVLYIWVRNVSASLGHRDRCSWYTGPE